VRQVSGFVPREGEPGGTETGNWNELIRGRAANGATAGVGPVAARGSHVTRSGPGLRGGGFKLTPE
jgi:hypothetical protein